MKEYGRIGQKRWEGVFNEEFLPELSGIRGVKTYREMLDNDDTIGAIMFAIKMLIRQVKWHVEPGGDSTKDREAAEFVESCMDDMQSTWTDALDAYLEGNIDEPVRWLVRFWQDQAAVMLYRELREIVIGETDPESLFDIWFQDYSKMLSERMTPVWEQAFLEGWKNNSLFCGAEDVISSESWVRSWIVDHTGDLITNCCNEQVSAIRYLIAEAESLNMSSAETARYIRPTIGLTERQAAANLKYYNSIKERLTTDHPRMKPESIERKAREAASKYAERQQQYRAETIARSEIAQAYNHGADAFVREAVTTGNLPEMEKEWSTALDGHVCASCAALEGTKIGMDDEFKTVSGRREIATSIPPLHPRCKCAVKYVRVKNENIQ